MNECIQIEAFHSFVKANIRDPFDAMDFISGDKKKEINPRLALWEAIIKDDKL